MTDFADISDITDRTLLDALLEDAEEHEAAGRVLQAANARAAVENLRVLWGEYFECYAWIGEDERGSGEIGLKQGLAPSGLVPLVAVHKHKINQAYLRSQLEDQVAIFGKPIRLVRLVWAEDCDRIE